MFLPKTYSAVGETLEPAPMPERKKGAVGPVAELGLSMSGLREFAKLPPEERTKWLMWPGADRQLMEILDKQTLVWRSALAKRKSAVI